MESKLPVLSVVLGKFLYVPIFQNVASDTEVFKLLSHKQYDNDCNLEHANLNFKHQQQHYAAHSRDAIVTNPFLLA